MIPGSAGGGGWRPDLLDTEDAGLGYIEITMEIMMSDSHNLSPQVLTPQHGLYITKTNIFDEQISRPPRQYIVNICQGTEVVTGER